MNLTSVINNSISTTCTTTYNVEQVKAYNIDEFLKIEDKELQKYLKLKHLVYNLTSTRKHEDDDKIGYYTTTSSVAMNVQGAFYKKSKLHQWISYSKKTKKVKVSSDHSDVKSFLIKEYFNFPELINRYIRKLTPTLCKKIIEGKICSVEDLLKYHRSYTVKMKDLDLDVLNRYYLTSEERCLYMLKDPENLKTITDFGRLKFIDHEVKYSLPFKFRVDEIEKVNERYYEWLKTQGKRLSEFEGRGNGEDGNSTDKSVIYQGPDFCATVSI